MENHKTKRIAFISLGCAKNLVNSEQMMFLLKEAGYEVTGEVNGSDAVVINTCGFIESAKTEAIETILEISRDKEEGRTGKIVVTGCLAERYKEEILAELPEIDAVVGTGRFDDITEVVDALLAEKLLVTARAENAEYTASLRACPAIPCNTAHNSGDCGSEAAMTGEGLTGNDRLVATIVQTTPMARTENAPKKPALFGNLDGPASETGRIITTSPVWTYLKIAEGCDNRCAYCAIPDIRGRFRSRPFERIVEEAQMLASRGLKEMIIVAQDVTRYGLDMYGKRRLAPLLEELCRIGGLEWIRLHYLYPDEIDDEIIDVIAKNDTIVKYLDIPFQHISDNVLQKMRRRGTGREIRGLIDCLRRSIPGVVLRTSIITGLPGEGEREFEELCGFLQEAKIERAGVFPFSPEEGTPAAQMSYADRDTAEKRAEQVGNIQSRILDGFNDSRTGSITRVLVEGRRDGKYYGRSYAESPDVDGYININGKGLTKHRFYDVQITGVADGEPVGRVITA